MSPKAILFITREIVPYYYGGIGTLFMSIARLLSAAGHRVSFLTEFRDNFDHDLVKNYYGDVEFFFADSAREDCFVDYSPSGGVVSTYNLAYSFSVAEAYRKYVEKIEPDLVISADFGAESFVLNIFHALGEFPQTRFILHLSGALREVLTVYQGAAGIEYDDELNEPQNRLICSMEDTCMLLADEVVVPTEHAWKEVRQRLHIEEKEVHVIPNLFAPNFEVAAVNRVKEISGKKYILFIGRLDRHKGADRLLQLFFEYQEKYPTETQLIMLGRDCFSKEYGRTFLEEWQNRIPLEIRDKIIFKGQVEPDVVAGYLENASICVFPSRWEVFGIVCLEAMSYGVPSIVASDTGLVEILGEELDEFVYDFENEFEQLLDKLHELLSASEDQNNLSEKIKRRAQQVLDEGSGGYKALVEDAAQPKDSDGFSNAVIEKIMHALQATSEVNYFLSHDFKSLAEHCRMTPEEIKKIIQNPKSRSPDFLSKVKNIFR